MFRRQIIYMIGIQSKPRTSVSNLSATKTGKDVSVSEQKSSLLCIVPPVLQRLVAPAARILFSSFFLRKMSLAVLWACQYHLQWDQPGRALSYRNNFSHVRNVIVVVFLWISAGIVFEDVDDLTSTASVCQTRITLVELSTGSTFHDRSFRPIRHLCPNLNSGIALL